VRWESVPALRQKTRHLNFIDISTLLRTQKFALKSAGRVPVTSDERRFPFNCIVFSKSRRDGAAWTSVAW
jgi:hypothetical protein